MGVVVAVGWVVAGCTGDGEPGPSPSVSVSVEPSPSQTPEASPTEEGPVKPDRPAAMERHDAEGAAAAAEYFVSLYDYVLATGELSEWNDLSHDECGFCSETADQAAWLQAEGGEHTGGAMTLTIEEPDRYVRDQNTGIWPFDATAAQADFLVTDAAGNEVASGSAETRSVRVEVGQIDGRWTIVEIAPLPGS